MSAGVVDFMPINFTNKCWLWRADWMLVAEPMPSTPPLFLHYEANAANWKYISFRPKPLLILLSEFSSFGSLIISNTGSPKMYHYQPVIQLTSLATTLFWSVETLPFLQSFQWKILGPSLPSSLHEPLGCLVCVLSLDCLSDSAPTTQFFLQSQYL
jgi:hypothetical protein